MSLARLYKDNSLLADVLDVLEKYVGRVRLAFGAVTKNRTVFSIEKAPIDVLLQTVDLNVTTLNSARRAVNLMLPRLSPLDPELIEWDLAGPYPISGERTRFTLAIARRADLESWNADNPEKIDLNIRADSETEYTFRSSSSRVSKRHTIAKWSLVTIVAYAAIWFALGSWAERPDRVSNTWVAESNDARQAISNNRDATALLVSETEFIETYQNGYSGRKALSILADVSEALSDDAWLQEFLVQNSQVRINGYIKSPSILAERLEANKFVERIELGPVSVDSRSGLNRFSLTLVLKAEKSPAGAN